MIHETMPQKDKERKRFNYSFLSDCNVETPRALSTLPAAVKRAVKGALSLAYRPPEPNVKG